METTDLDFDRTKVLTHIVRRCLVSWRVARCFLLLFYAKRGLRACEVVALELSQQRQDLVVGEQRRALIEDLLGG